MNDNRVNEADETETVSIKVNVDNYARATTSAQFQGMLRMSRGMNKFVHAPNPVALNKQSVERMNRDTIYSSAIVDLSKGASLTVPDAGDRYLSVIVMNEDYYTTAIYHSAGVYSLAIDEHETPFVAVVARVLTDRKSVV